MQYSHLLQNFPHFVVIHIVKGFSVVNAGVFLTFPGFFYDPVGDGSMISGSSAFSKSSLYIWKFSVKMFYCYFLGYYLFIFGCPGPSLLSVDFVLLRSTGCKA